MSTLIYNTFKLVFYKMNKDFRHSIRDTTDNADSCITTRMIIKS